MSVTIIKKIKEENFIPYIDIAIAEYLTAKNCDNDNIFILFCFLSAAVRSGHLCVKVNSSEIHPSPKFIWENEDFHLNEEEWQELERLLKRGAIALKSHTNPAIVNHQDLFYFEKYWNYENDCLNFLDKLLQQKPKLQLDRHIFENQIKNLKDKRLLLDAQAIAIENLNDKTLSIICGGPGTGKTYTAGLIIKTFWEALCSRDRKRCLIGLTAPTGKACANLQKSIEKQVNDLEDFPLLKAQTLHSLLNVKKSSSAKNFINYDLLIIDECSMIDIKIMSLLFKALKPGCRLILLGDTFQLPSVEAGSFFNDLTFLAKDNTVFLDKCVRTDLADIVDFSNSVKTGDFLKLLHQLRNSSTSLKWEIIDRSENVSLFKTKLFGIALSYLNRPQESNLTHFCILTPLRKGPFGSLELNEFFYDEMRKRSTQNVLKIPIIIRLNDAKKDLYNGDTGFLFKHLDKSASDYAIIQNRKIPIVLLPSFEYAYCLSVHKSQGSEFEHVLILLPPGSESFGREMLYTAVTRAKKSLEVFASFETLEKTLKSTTLRLSKTNHNSIAI